MHQSIIIAVFLAAILVTSALTSLPFFVVDAKATANDKSDITHKDVNTDKQNKLDEEYDEEYDYEKSSYGQDNVDLQCEECIKYGLDLLNQGQVSNFVNILAKYINFINWGGGVDCTLLDAPINPPDNKLAGVECLPIASSNTKKQDLAQTLELGQQLVLAIPSIAARDNTDIPKAFETFATGFEVAISRSCANEGGAQLCRAAEDLLECLGEKIGLVPEEDEDITHNVSISNKNVLSSQLEQEPSQKQKQKQQQEQQ
jgi:hypothetical protein